MKRLFSKIILFLCIFSLMIGVLTGFKKNLIYAADLDLVGNELGLVIKSDSDRILDVSNLNPGDTQEAKLNIKNEYSSPFRLFIRSERSSQIAEKGESDLLEQIETKVYIDDEEVYSGSMMDFTVSNIDLGKFDPDSNSEFKTIIHLSGPEMGNEFQGESVDLKWIFIAEAEEELKPVDKHNLPKTGQIPLEIYYGLGGVLLVLGYAIGWKKNKIIIKK